MSDEIGEVPQIIQFSVLQRKRRDRGTCFHRRFEVDDDAGVVYCQDCETEVPPFVALKAIAQSTSMFQAQHMRLREEIAALKNWKPWLKAMKELEHIWRKRGGLLPTCPHCKRGIEAEDLARTSRINRAYEQRILGND